MDERKAHARRALTGAHIAIVITLLIIWGVTLYNYASGGRLNLTAVVWSLILLAVLISQRLSFRDKSDSR